MVAKRESDKSTEVFELHLTHSDIIDMMNDPDVLLDDGTVASDQELEIACRKTSGSESVLCKIIVSDTLVLRFRRTVITDTTTPLNDVDIT